MSMAGPGVQMLQLYEILFEQSADGIVLGRSDGAVVRANPAACRLLAMDEPEIVRLGREGVMVDDAEYRAWLDRRARDGVARGRLRFRRGDGSAFIAEVTSGIVTGTGDAASSYTIFRDVTDLQSAEDALRRSERLYRTAAHHFPGGVLGLFGRDLRLVLHDGTRSAYSSRPGSLVGQAPAEYAAPDEAEALERVFREALSGSEGHLERRLGGRIFEVSTYPVRGDDGNVDLGMVMTRDVTEERALQAQLQVASRLAALGTLVSGVTHEMNNPLTISVANLGVALADIDEALAGLRGGAPLDRADLLRRLEDLREAVGDALAGDQRIARIVKDLDSFSRRDPRRARLRLADVVEETMRWLPASISRGAEIRIEDRSPPDVVASSAEIGQVIVALLANAARASPTGRKARVTLSLGPGAPGMSLVEVADDGAGMAPEVLERIFDPFFTTREVGQGMGLGLPICHAIVTGHGGTLTATSRPGSGSTFRIELPAA